MSDPQSAGFDPGGPPPPPMCEAWLDASALADLFDDLAGCAELLSVQVKAAAREQVGETAITLALASELLRSGAVRGAQIRYRFQGCEWCDTIMNVHGRFRLIRCQHP